MTGKRASLPLPSERQLAAAAVVLAAARLALAPAVALFPQEAYYALYARYPALSYFDHPPAIAWVLRCFTAIWGETPLTLRFAAGALAAATAVAYWRLVAALVPPGPRRFAALSFLATPLLAVVGFAATPDGPLLLCTALALLALWRAGTGQTGAWWWAGVWSGLAFDAKYSAVFLPVGLGLWAALDRSGRVRAALRTRGPWLGAGLGLFFTAPVWVWNAQHRWASIRFQTLDRLAAAPGLQLRFFAGLVASQTALVGLGFAAALWLGLRRAWHTVPADRAAAASFTAAFSVAFLGAALVASLGVQVKPNWLYPFYLAAFPFAALTLAHPRRFGWATLGMGLAVQLAGAVELLAYPVPVRSLDTWIGWQELADEVRRRAPPGDFLAAADGYKTAAELEFYLRRKVYGPNLLGAPGLQYDYRGDDLAALRGGDGLLLRAELGPTPGPAPQALLARCLAIEPLPPISLHFGGRLARTVSVFRCRGYRGP